MRVEGYCQLAVWFEMRFASHFRLEMVGLLNVLRDALLTTVRGMHNAFYGSLTAVSGI